MKPECYYTVNTWEASRIVPFYQHRIEHFSKIQFKHMRALACDLGLQVSPNRLGIDDQHFKSETLTTAEI